MNSLTLSHRAHEDTTAASVSVAAVAAVRLMLRWRLQLAHRRVGALSADLSCSAALASFDILAWSGRTFFISRLTERSSPVTQGWNEQFECRGRRVEVTQSQRAAVAVAVQCCRCCPLNAPHRPDICNGQQSILFPALLIIRPECQMRRLSVFVVSAHGWRVGCRIRLAARSVLARCAHRSEGVGGRAGAEDGGREGARVRCTEWLLLCCCCCCGCSNNEEGEEKGRAETSLLFSSFLCPQRTDSRASSELSRIRR